MYKKLKNCLGVHLFTLIFKVMLERERSELSRASRNIKAILLKKTNSIVFRFIKRHHRTCSGDLGATSD